MPEERPDLEELREENEELRKLIGSQQQKVEEMVRDKEELKEEIGELREKYEEIEKRRTEADDLMTKLVKDPEVQSLLKEKLKELELGD